MSIDNPPLIAHIVFAFDYGGLENGIVNLINTMPADEFRHVVIALTTASHFQQRIKRADVQVFELNKRAGKDLGASWRLFKLLRRLKPALVHTRNMGTMDCLLAARAAGVRRCFHGEHGWDIHDPDGTNKKYRWMRRILNVLVTRFTVVSADLGNWLTGIVGIDPSKVEHICNGVDTARFNSEKPSDAKLPKDVFADDSIVIGSVARFKDIKDPLNLVDAFIVASRSGNAHADKLRLLFVGDGPLRDTALKRLDESGLAHAAWLPGSRDDVASLLSSMDVFVLGSLREGISNTILEAMASGLPVIATDTGGNPELVEQGINGMLVPPGDSVALAASLLEYASSQTLRAEHAAASRRLAESKFSLQTMADKYAAAYRKALSA